MKVLNLYGIGDLRLDERDIPEISKDEALLAVKACGICSSDDDRIYKTGTYHFPTVPGHEFAGQIVKVGSSENEALVGKKASVFPMLPCFSCESCMKKEYATCSNYKYFGSRNDGGFSEYLAVPVWNLNVLDDIVSYEVGALSEPTAVANNAAHMAELKKGYKVAVIGTGTIGVLIGALCKNLGADVTIVGRREVSLLSAKGFNLETVLVDNAADLFEKNGLDAVFDAVGSNESMSLAIEIAKPNGTIVAVGNPKGDFFLEKNIYWKILRKQLTIKGSWNSCFKGARDDWQEAASLMAEGVIPFERLITEKYSLEDYRKAMERFRDRSKPKSRIMFAMGETSNE